MRSPSPPAPEANAQTSRAAPPGPAAQPERLALTLHVRGVVQGVGFRPFVHRLAVRCSIAGSVRNESGEVRIEAEGRSDDVQRFISALHAEAPPLARIDGIDITPAALRVLPGFQVMPSLVEGAGRLPVSPDVAICEACRTELFDATNRRYRYPFITCTDCGPRFTVIESMPYDRERTSMRAFAQCGACRREYESPLDRRYHSETNSCPACGPAVWLESPTQPGRRSNHGAEAIAGAASRLLRGEIVAIRGLGGFHLAADATNEAAVARLRERKAREAKPLALMVATLEDARRLAFISAGEQEWLTSPERPIVIVRARPGNGIASRVSPGLDSIGIVLAYTPLHLLLLEQTDRPLIMTSGNRSDEPIATGNAEAARRLGGVADAFLLHDREIVARYDDSVVRVADDTRIILRRARGYAPLPIALPVPSPLPLLAVGPHLKNTFTLAEGERAFVSQHIGDLENLETLEHFHAALARFRDLFRITPRAVVRDRHPGYLSTRVAEELGIARVIAVQHHHAHIAAVAAEHGRAGRVVGLAFDGTGYGDDGLVWGAEALVADLLDFTRVGQLRYAPLPGGDLAARRPWRAALGFLSLEPAAAPAFARALQPVRAAERSAAEAQIARRINAPLASSMGRLFDAAAAVLGLRHENRYEGQAAMELETLAGQRSAEPLPFPLLPSGEGWVMDPLPLLAALGERTIAGEAVEDLAARLHESVAATAAELAARICEAEQLDTVALGGGVFQNARLLVSTRRRLTDRGLDVLVPRELSPNDGAISYGQAAIAAAQLTAAC